MNKLITQLTESINSKLEDVNRYSKMISLVATKDVKAMRRFIHSQDTFEKETFFEMLDHGDNAFFHKVYPHAEVAPNRSYAVSIIAAQFEYDKEDEKVRFGLDFDDIYDGRYPTDYSDAEFPDHADESDPVKAMAM